MSEKRENYGFDKNEGFIGNVDDFNGIIFCLREPNTNNKKAEEFWFQKVINQREQYFQELKEKKQGNIVISKRIATRFKNEFVGILEQLKIDETLSNIAFCNVNSEKGRNKVEKEYNVALEKADEKMEEIVILSPKKQLRIFTCVDIYEKLKNAWNDKYDIKEEKEKGIKYLQTKTGKTVKRNRFTCQIADKNVTVYDMYHPSRVGRYKLWEKLLHELNENSK